MYGCLEADRCRHPPLKALLVLVSSTSQHGRRYAPVQKLSRATFATWALHIYTCSSKVWHWFASSVGRYSSGSAEATEAAWYFTTRTGVQVASSATSYQNTLHVLYICFKAAKAGSGRRPTVRYPRTISLQCWHASASTTYTYTVCYESAITPALGGGVAGRVRDGALCTHQSTARFTGQWSKGAQELGRAETTRGLQYSNLMMSCETFRSHESRPWLACSFAWRAVKRAAAWAAPSLPGGAAHCMCTDDRSLIGPHYRSSVFHGQPSSTQSVRRADRSFATGGTRPIQVN